MHHLQLINLALFVSAPNEEGSEYPHNAIKQATKQEILDQFVGWEPEFIQALEVHQAFY